MRGLDPRISLQARAMPQSWVYIVTNRPSGVLYTGVTAHLARRVHEHRTGLADGFTTKYRLTRLVYYEQYDQIVAAIQREKNIKHWPRAWKIELIEKTNPQWQDLYLALNM
jgi:putative endonuclease